MKLNSIFAHPSLLTIKCNIGGRGVYSNIFIFLFLWNVNVISAPSHATRATTSFACALAFRSLLCLSPKWETTLSLLIFITSYVTEPSIERQRATFDRRELELMAEVRDLRKRLAARRQYRPPDFLTNTQQWPKLEEIFYFVFVVFVNVYIQDDWPSL